jgi:hypothetical protein
VRTIDNPQLPVGTSALRVYQADLDDAKGGGPPGDLPNGPRRRYLPSDAPRLVSNRALRRRWAGIANRRLTETGDPEVAEWDAARDLVVQLDYAGHEAGDLPATLGGAAGRRQRSTAASGEGTGEIAERVAFGPSVPYDYDGPGGRTEAIAIAAAERRASSKAARARQTRARRQGRRP